MAILTAAHHLLGFQLSALAFSAALPPSQPLPFQSNPAWTLKPSFNLTLPRTSKCVGASPSSGTSANSRANTLPATYQPKTTTTASPPPPSPSDSTTTATTSATPSPCRKSSPPPSKMPLPTPPISTSAPRGCSTARNTSTQSIWSSCRNRR